MADYKHFEKRLCGVAKKLTKDIHLMQDLLQEMRWKIWQAEEGHTDSYYLEMGLNAGKRYMERFIEPHRYCVPLEDEEIDEFKQDF